MRETGCKAACGFSSRKDNCSVFNALHLQTWIDFESDDCYDLCLMFGVIHSDLASSNICFQTNTLMDMQITSAAHLQCCIYLKHK